LSPRLFFGFNFERHRVQSKHAGGIKPQMDVTPVIKRKDGNRKEAAVLLRIDTPIEVDYYFDQKKLN
jgi:aconitase A